MMRVSRRSAVRPRLSAPQRQPQNPRHAQAVAARSCPGRPAPGMSAYRWPAQAQFANEIHTETVEINHERLPDPFQATKIYPTRGSGGDCEGLQPFHQQRRVRLPDRPFRLRQIDRAFHGGGPESVTAGGIILAGSELTGPGPDRGVVFQSPCLLPWLTALENVMLGVDQVFYTAAGKSGDRLPNITSRWWAWAIPCTKAGRTFAGMRQRVGIARAFALSPNAPAR